MTPRVNLWIQTLNWQVIKYNSTIILKSQRPFPKNILLCAGTIKWLTGTTKDLADTKTKVTNLTTKVDGTNLIFNLNLSWNYIQGSFWFVGTVRHLTATAKDLADTKTDVRGIKTDLQGEVVIHLALDKIEYLWLNLVFV